MMIIVCNVSLYSLHIGLHQKEKDFRPFSSIYEMNLLFFSSKHSHFNKANGIE